MWLKCNHRNRGETEVSTAEAKAMIPMDRCIVFMRHNKSKWLRCSGSTVHVETPPEFLAESSILTDGKILIRPIPPVPVEE